MDCQQQQRQSFSRGVYETISAHTLVYIVMAHHCLQGQVQDSGFAFHI